jgi:hypothetical protein
VPPNEVAIIDKEMDTLPKDPAMLVSAVNMLLRDDEFDTLESLCCNFDTEPLALRRTLLLEGYVYSESQRQMRPVGFDGADGVGKDSVEVAHSFFHQKWNIYKASTLDWQKDDIEQAIASYAAAMPAALCEMLSCGREGFLQTHATFADDLQFATEALEKLL